ncbi:MAG: c-type cytochrome [Nitrospiria bacterium]
MNRSIMALNTSVKCYKCHGDYGEGAFRAPALRQSGKTIPKRQFVRVVLEGRGRMPRFKNILTEDEILLIRGWLEEIPPFKVKTVFQLQ